MQRTLQSSSFSIKGISRVFAEKENTDFESESRDENNANGIEIHYLADILDNLSPEKIDTRRPKSFTWTTRKTSTFFHDVLG